MDKETDNKRREDFRAILKDLAKSQTLLGDKAERSEFYTRLDKLYYIDKSTRFRHYYSDIFSVLIEIQNDSSKGDIPTLGQNIAILSQNYRSLSYDNDNNPIDISDSLRKLYDHVSLDIARIEYSNMGDDRLSGNAELQAVTAQLDQAKKEINVLTQETKSLKDELSSSQRDYIAILGIFASIVLAFVGELAFSTSVFNNIGKASIYSLLTISLVVGLVFVTIIFALFYYIGILTNKSSPQADPLKPLYISYAVFIGLLLLVISSWWMGAVEERDERVNSDYSSTIDATDSINTSE